LEGVFKWVAFPSSRRDKRVPIPNQYFGAFQDGTLKYRGIELRRRDTTTWVRKVQLAALQIMAQADTMEELSESVTDVLALMEHVKRDLRTGSVPLEELVVRQKISRELDAYKSPSPAARAALQLRVEGKEVTAGQSIRFMYTRGGCGVHAWELEEKLDYRRLDTKRYCTLLERAIQTVLDPCQSQFAANRLI
jgi:DNA polymerase-2